MNLKTWLLYGVITLFGIALTVGVVLYLRSRTVAEIPSLSSATSTTSIGTKPRASPLQKGYTVRTYQKIEDTPKASPPNPNNPVLEDENLYLPQ